jgi:hypothetical protein
MTPGSSARLTNQDGPRLQQQKPASTWYALDQDVQHKIDSGTKYHWRLSISMTSRQQSQRCEIRNTYHNNQEELGNKIVLCDQLLILAIEFRQDRSTSRKWTDTNH